MSEFESLCEDDVIHYFKNRRFQEITSIVKAYPRGDSAERAEAALAHMEQCYRHYRTFVDTGESPSGLPTIWATEKQKVRHAKGELTPCLADANYLCLAFIAVVYSFDR